MPHSVRPCAKAGCEFIIRDEKGCPTHPPTKRWSKTDNRPNSNARLYTHRWRKAAKAFLAKHPLCTACTEKGKVVPANTCDHITPHRGDRGLFWQRSNWQPLCQSCHSRKTARGE